MEFHKRELEQSIAEIERLKKSLDQIKGCLEQRIEKLKACLKRSVKDLEALQKRRAIIVTIEPDCIVLTPTDETSFFALKKLWDSKPNFERRGYGLHGDAGSSRHPTHHSIINSDFPIFIKRRSQK